MATMGKLFVAIFLFLCLFFLIVSANLIDHSVLMKHKNTDFVLERHKRDDEFSKPAEADQVSVFQRVVRSSIQKSRSRSRRDVDSDAKCSSQAQKFKDLIKEKKNFASTVAFVNETKSSMAVVWAGNNNGRILVAVTEEYFGYLAKPSVLYASKDHGLTFSPINDKVNNNIIRKANGLLKNNYNSQQVFVVVYTSTATSDIYITENGGDDFTGPHHLPFLLEDGIDFHPTDPKYMLAQSISEHKLYLSKDGGRNWQLIHEHVFKFAWHDDMEDNRRDRKGTIYIQSSPKLNKGSSLQQLLTNNDFQLSRSESFGIQEDDWTVLHSHVFGFQVKGRFLFVSSGKDSFRRYMRVSTDAGSTWNEVQLPSLTSDQFYSIMDMSEEVVFMHVDKPGETGFGTLYVSDSKGIIYSESLQRHLYPNHEEVTDFYRVQSMNGVYLASQLMADNSIHTVISFDRGAEWKPIPRPDKVDCKDEKKACNLQIHNQYSASRRVVAQPPLSLPTAPGIILAHGHVAEALQTSLPDVYVTSDGGYTWIPSLKGPHHYQIADHGGLLVAVPSDTYTPTVVKISTDEGRCWHEYIFTNESIIFTGLLTEPGGKSMSVSIWGYGATDHVWRITVLDFLTVIPQQCQESDYKYWTSHLGLHGEKDVNFKGCRLGAKVTYKRLKIDSWCHNGYPHQVTTKKETCTCRRDDYECDYGYYRPVGGDDCVIDEQFEHMSFDICKGGRVEKLISKGYRKVPGDICTGGFQSPPIQEVDISKKCNEDSKKLVIQELNQDVISNTTAKPGSSGSAAVTAIVVIVLLIVLLMVMYFGRKYYLNRKNISYRYSSLTQSEEFDYDNDFENALVRHATVYEDTSDDDMLAKKKTDYGANTNNRQSTSTAGQPKKVKSYHDDSDVDMLD